MSVFIAQRVLNITPSSIQVLFTENLSTDIGVNNISITPSYSSVPTPSIISVIITDNVMTVNFSPLFDNIKYKLVFFSTTSVKFKSTSGSIITEDGNTNVVFLVSPGEDTTIFSTMLDDIGNTYQLDAPSNVRDIVRSSADQLQKASDATQTVASSNYISITATDELKTRGIGPFDQFDNGGVFEILRVSNTATGATKTTDIPFDSSRSVEFSTYTGSIVNPIIKSLPSDPISLQAVDVIDELVSDNINLSNFFDGLNIRVSSGPVIQLISLALITQLGQVIPYDITKFGYILEDNFYDTKSASKNVTLGPRDIQLSSTSLNGQIGGFILPVAGDTIKVSYIYKKLGRSIDSTSVALTTINQNTRELTPSITTSFFLKNAPIVFDNDTIPSVGGVVFLNTQAFNGNPPLSTNHPAFLREIPFSTSSIPNAPGNYSVNYLTGQVFVFGEDTRHQGTGSAPPAATYLYRQSFISDIDYTYNSDTSNLAVKSNRDISGIDAKITFNYQDNYAEGTDYRFLSHIEVTNERVNNNLVGEFQIVTNEAPITDVFRIFNESTGEVYTLDHFNDTTITFTGRNAPKQTIVTRERIGFVRVPQETLILTDTLVNAASLNVFMFKLQNSGITDSQSRFIGANFNTSVSFSRQDLFLREFFYENKLFVNVNSNINRLKQVGDYIIDYDGGVVYLAVTPSQIEDVGDISYSYNNIETKNNHILQVSNLYRNSSQALDNIVNYNVLKFTDNSIIFKTLENVAQRFIDGDPNRILIIGSYQNGTDGVHNNNSNYFSSISANFTAEDIGRTLRIGSSDNTPVQEFTILNIINNHQVVLDSNFSVAGVNREWVILNLNFNAPKTITLDHTILSITNIYSATQIGTEPFNLLDGYYFPSSDSFSGNVVTLSASNPLNVGDAVVVDYNYGNIYVDYTYLADELLVTYEYGPNAIDWSISNILSPGNQYFVTYKYGALRDALLLNFGALTQIPQLTNFPVDFNREVYRSVVGGTIQSFITGPTIPSIDTLVESFTSVQPVIDELAFDSWILGRDYLYLAPLKTNNTPIYELGKFNNGILIEQNQDGVKVPAISHFRLKDGTMETWVRPNWDGYANDATLNFDIKIDGYYDTSSVFIGFNAVNPEEIPFSINKNSLISPLGKPNNLDAMNGYFIWFDEFNNNWNIHWSGKNDYDRNFTGKITTSGNFYDVKPATDSLGNSINEIDDLITTISNVIYFDGYIDGYDSFSLDGYSSDGIKFSSGNIHYIFDMGLDKTSNRVSLFNDGTGNLVFQVYDNQGEKTKNKEVGRYVLSSNIKSWKSNELHQVATTWSFNSTDETDQMHLFIDGKEVPNLYKYGGEPVPDGSNLFGDIAKEVVISSATRPIVGASTGQTQSGSGLFIDQSTNFSALGIVPGDNLYIIEPNQDGLNAPNNGAPYTIIGVGTDSVLVNRNFSLNLSNVKYSINQYTAVVKTPLTYQKFIVISGGNELSGPNSSNPSYYAKIGSGNSQVISITNGVGVGDQVIIETLGLVFRKCRELCYVYDGYQLRTNSAAPVLLNDVVITMTNLPRTLIDSTGFLNTTDLFGPSNSSSGKKLSVSLSGENINFSLPATVTINGNAFGGPTSEILTFTSAGTINTTNYWLNLNSVVVSVLVYNSSEPAGAIQITEMIPLTVSENGGNYAKVYDYSNGLFSLEVSGSGGMQFMLPQGFYEINYPTFLRIKIDKQPKFFIIGNDYTFSHPFNGLVDEFRILRDSISDTRPGDIIKPGQDTITVDFNNIDAFSDTNNTLLLAHLDDNLLDSSAYRDAFNIGYELDPSLNASFEQAIRLVGDKPFIINNGSKVFNNNEGTIEFWVNPLEDTNNDPNYRYYIDTSSTVSENATSITKINVVASQKIRKIESVRLATDVFGVGTNYFSGGSVSTVDGKTITLGIPLPAQNTPVIIVYVPLSSQGDRVSIFKDPNGFINFFVTGKGIDHVVSVHVDWKRHTWHRVMAMYQANSSNSLDRIRLFVDGEERGVIKYGTGLRYGTGVIYGQQEIRPGVNRFVVDRITLTDTFSNIYVGTDILGVNPAFALMDNLRFSDIQRLNSIVVVGGTNIDLNYTSNIQLAVPVIQDDNTTGIFDFNHELNTVQFLATLLDPTKSAFRFNVEVIDSFNKITNNTYLQNLLVQLINTIKPAHTLANIVFKK